MAKTKITIHFTVDELTGFDRDEVADQMAGAMCDLDEFEGMGVEARITEVVYDEEDKEPE